jgi:hypothetical protein
VKTFVAVSESGGITPEILTKALGWIDASGLYGMERAGGLQEVRMGAGGQARRKQVGHRRDVQWPNSVSSGGRARVSFDLDTSKTPWGWSSESPTRRLSGNHVIRNKRTPPSSFPSPSKWTSQLHTEVRLRPPQRKGIQRSDVLVLLGLAGVLRQRRGMKGGAQG